VATGQDEFERVAMPHARGLLRVAHRLTSDTASAEDLVQETLLLAWRNFRQFQAGTNARAWLFRILLNSFYAQGRRRRTDPSTVPISAIGMDASSESAVATSYRLESPDVSRALSELHVDHRTVLLLGIVEGFTCREMAEILRLPVGTVMSRLSRARGALRARLTPSAPLAGKRS
jgi:RNA polymerase sigma-70 factor (ECF subfamily)